MSIRKCAALYLRLSKQDDASTSIVRQEADLRARADREGWDVTHVLTDDGISGRRARENADRALDLLAGGDVDVLAVWKFDRWSRQGLGTVARLIGVLDERAEALFVAECDGLTSAQPAWRIIASVLAEVARMESESISARVESSIDALRRGYRFAGGIVPFGYMSTPNPDGPGRILSVDPVEAEIIREIADRILAGESVYRLSIELNERGIPTTRSEARRLRRAGKSTEDADVSTWTAENLRRLMSAPHLLGRQTHKGDVLRDEHGLPLEIWSPILAKPTHAALVEVLVGNRERNRGSRRKARPKASRLLSQIAHCEVCGSRLYVLKRSDDRIIYYCPSKSTGRPCPSPRITAPPLEAHVAEQVLERIGHLDVTTTEIVETGIEEGASDLADVEEAIRTTTAALGEASADEEEDLFRRLRDLKARREAAREAAKRTPVLRRVVRTGKTYAEAYSDADDVDAKRCILSAFLDKVEVAPQTEHRNVFDPERVTIRWRPE